MKRYKSHLRLKPAEQNCQPYMLIATYPENFSIGSIQTNVPKAYEQTTDEVILGLMLANKTYTSAFAEACYEVSIECQFMREKFPDMKCRTCAPNNAKLYNDDGKNPPYATLPFDIVEMDPCQQISNEEVDAKILKMKIAGKEFTYYYTIGANGNIDVYYHNAKKNIYEKIMPIAPNYKAIIAEITK
jgi:hypothetical protein